MPTKTAARGYGGRHQELRRRYAPIVLAGGVRCAACHELIQPGEPWDLGHVPGDRTRYRGPEHRSCNRSAAGRVWDQQAPVEIDPEREGIPADDPRWRVPWLEEFLRVPEDATWPRFMTVPHPAAVGSLGREFIAWAERRSGRPLRWWQRLVAVRLLEIDAEGRLVWETAVLSTARQVGKSWLLRELCLWRIHQGERIGEPQDVLHTGKDLAICKEIQRPARFWAKARPDRFKVREVNGQEEIENLADGSRWMLRAKEAVYGYGASFAVADEAWKVKASSIEEGLTPTMAERLQPQLLLVSTAHRLATSLMLRRRALALADLDNGDGDLIIEWSAPIGAALEDREGWRQASPHWSDRRERLISKQLDALMSGEIEDPEEPDPEASFRAQYLNQWPRKLTEPPGNMEDLLPDGLWAALVEPGLGGLDPIIVAIEDDFGRGAAVAAARRLDDGRIEIDGWVTDDWDAAIADVERLAIARQIQELHVGASLLDRVPRGALPHPRPAASGQTRAGLAVFRDLAATGGLVHDQTTAELDQAIGQTQVRESPSGLVIARGPQHLVKAVVWAVGAAHRPARIPAIL